VNEEIVFNSDGSRKEDANRDVDGELVPLAEQAKASLMGALRLLEEIARKGDDGVHRRAARVQADGLRAMIRRMNNGGNVVADMERELKALAAAPRKLTSAPRALTHDTIDMDDVK
jgi:hypothetical protein